MILPDTDILPGMKLRATLPYKNAASRNELPAKPLDTEPLRFRIAAVS